MFGLTETFELLLKFVLNLLMFTDCNMKLKLEELLFKIFALNAFRL